MSTPLKFTIVTPSYRQLPWLQLCTASVTDQEGVDVEHIIQDAGSGSELAAWVRAHTRARLYVEEDTGMYDAINRGFEKATGDIVAWLNCDEQYLPGALARVAAFFERHPEVDVLFGDAVLIDPKGGLLAYRRVVRPSRLHVRFSHRDVLSCATFFRRSVVERFPLDQAWKVIADALWLDDLLRARLPMSVLGEPLAAFTLLADNLSHSDAALEENRRWQKQVRSPGDWWLKPLVILFHRLRKLARGAYVKRDFKTRLYTRAFPGQRVPVEAIKLAFTWPQAAAR